MNTTQRWTIAIITAVAIGAALFLGGSALAQVSGNVNGIGFGPGNMMTGGYGGMMGGFGSSQLNDVNPLTIDQARQAVNGYVASLGNADLAVRDIMIFDNQAYAQIYEKSTGIGAMEVLVDPATLAISPEPGPNMMWNQKYGPMGSVSGYGMMGGRYSQGRIAPSTQMPVTSAQAVTDAQRYLDSAMSGTTADSQPDQFYGYYTLHILRNDQVIGMLSVNGYAGQVFLHTWHGTFITMSED